MKILVLNYEWPPLGGGAGLVARNLAAEYVKSGCSVHVITMKFKGLPDHEIENGVEIHRTPAVRKYQATCETHEMFSYLLGAYRPVMNLVNSNAFDVIHCHFLIPTGIIAARAAKISGKPLVITPHGSDIPGFNPDRFTREHTITRPILKFIAGRSRLVSPSNYLKKLIKQQIGDFENQVIPNGIEGNKFHPGEKKKSILMTGRLLPRKGFQHVLEALKNVESDYEIHICGDGPYKKELEKISEKVNMRVFFHGWLPHDSALLKRLYEESLIYCLPSERENASMALLEAMAAKMAVVTSDAAGCPETVDDAGVTLPFGNVGALRKALLKLMIHKGDALLLGEKAHTRVRKNFLWPDLASRYLDLFNNVIYAHEKATQ